MALRRRLTALYLLALALFTAGAGALAVHGALSAPPGCGRSDPAGSALIAAIAIGAFGLGHLAANYRTSPETARTSRHPRATAILVRGALFAFLLLVLLVLAYETAALAGVDGLQPITAYVRCARSAEPVPTAVAAAVVSFLIGHWLWFPDTAGR